MTTTTIEVTTTLQVTVETVVEITVTTIEVADMVILDKTNIAIKNTQINCKILMTSIIMKAKEWNMQMPEESKNKVVRKIKAFSTIHQEEEETEAVVVEVVGIEIMPGMTIKTQKLLEKAWLPTSNMSIQIIEATTIEATVVVVEGTTNVVITEVTIEVTIEVKIEVTIVTIIMIQDKTIGKMILTRSPIMNLRKISNKKK